MFSFLLCACRSLPVSSPAAEIPAGNVEVHFIDVGQGDCILLKSADSAVLIDAGVDEGKKKVISYLHSQGITKLDVAVGTHPHDDHIGALDDVIREFSPETIVMPKVSANTKAFEDILNIVAAQNKKIKPAKAGLKLTVGGMDLNFLSPQEDSNYSELNNYSAVIRMEYAGRSFLLCGDAERPAEDQMLKNGLITECDVIKIGHHGSDTSTSEEFLKAVSPEYAVVSVGANNIFGHPSKTVLKRLAAAEVSILRTDLDGTVVFTVDAKGKLAFRTERGKKNAA